MRKLPVNLNYVKRNSFRLGIYYVETGAGAAFHVPLQPQGQLDHRIAARRSGLGRILRQPGCT